ncbi:MAG: hypothetical protein Q4A71_04785 [Actinomycetaceae bacterium]|nr:hypothetical protein [Actinomycetaceae bacterium]
MVKSTFKVPLMSFVVFTFALASAGILRADLAHAGDTTINTVDTSFSSTIAGQEALEKMISDSFETIFSNAVQENLDGTFSVIPNYKGDIPDFSISQAQAFVDNLNMLHSIAQDKGAKEFGICVLKGIIPGAGLLQINWGNVYLWIKQHSWGKLAKYLAKHAAKIGFKDLAKLTPGGLASAVALSAAGCAIWGD